MSDTKTAKTLPPPRLHDFGAYISALAFAGTTLGVAVGDGRVALMPANGDVPDLPKAHKGAVLSLVRDPKGNGFYSGGDDGRLCRIGVDGSAAEIENFAGKWIESIATHPASGAIAVAAGKEARLIDDKLPFKFGPHPSTISDLGFSPDGSRLAVAHYGGVSVWNLKKPGEPARKLNWKGSHIRLAYSPATKFLATSTQESALHVWRLADGSDMQMSGYPAKVKSLAWTRNGLHLASSGAPGFVIWPFAGRGPEGKPPKEFASSDEPAMVNVVAAHPNASVIAAGDVNGSIELGDVDQMKVLALKPVLNGPISALAWSDDGFAIAAGTEAGQVAIFDLRLK
jgi:WD40 repeat protein